MKLSRSLIAVGAITALSVGALAGCSSSGSTDDGDSGGTGAALTIAKPDGAITTESHNPYLGDSSASKYGYAKVIFEPLALVNPTGDLGTTPWLAESGRVERCLHRAHRRPAQRRDVERRRGLHRRRHRLHIRPVPERQARRLAGPELRGRDRRRRRGHSEVRRLEVHRAVPRAAHADRSPARLGEHRRSQHRPAHR